MFAKCVLITLIFYLESRKISKVCAKIVLPDSLQLVVACVRMTSSTCKKSKSKSSMYSMRIVYNLDRQVVLRYASSK